MRAVGSARGVATWAAHFSVYGLTSLVGLCSERMRHEAGESFEVAWCCVALEDRLCLVCLPRGWLYIPSNFRGNAIPRIVTRCPSPTLVRSVRE